MKNRRRGIYVSILFFLVFGTAGRVIFTPTGVRAGDLPDGYLPVEESRRVLDKTLVIRLDPDLSSLTAGERRAAIANLTPPGPNARSPFVA